jgi:hypothetical protein
VSSCICPVDRNGTDCSQFVPFNCEAELVSPVPNCNNPYYQKQTEGDPKFNLLDSDPPCLVFSMDETVRLQYKLNCEFAVNITENLTPKQLAANFTYWISNDRFSIYEPTTWVVRYKIFNFNILSDSDATVNLALSTDQMQGYKHILFNTTLSAVADKFWAGNRLYAEVGWDRIQKPPGLPRSVLDRRFFDSPEYKGKGNDFATKSDTVTIVVAVVVPIGIMYVLLRCVILLLLVLLLLGTVY